MKPSSLTIIAFFFFTINSLFAQIKIGYIKNYNNWTKTLSVYGYDKKDYIKGNEGYSPNIEKCIFMGQSLKLDKLKSKDVAQMNINGIDIQFESKNRESGGDLDLPFGKIWLYNKNGYKIKYEEIKFNKEENDQPSKIRLTIFYKNQKKTILLEYEADGA